MGIFKHDFLKTKNRDFNNIIDSMKTHNIPVSAETSGTTLSTTTTISVEQAQKGTIFTNRGTSGGVNLQLPTAADNLEGCSVTFLGFVAHAVTMSCATADTIVARVGTVAGDVAADSVAIKGGQVIGSKMEAICDGSSWWVLVPTISGSIDAGIVTAT